MQQKLYILLILILVNIDSYAACVKISGSGSCVADGNNGCHVERGTTCEETGTPDGCQRITCNGSCPTVGYYIPYGSSTSWNSFKSNSPATISYSACPVLTCGSSRNESECTAAGGTLVNIGAGNICRFNATVNCPSGWSQCNNWSTTTASSCTAGGCDPVHAVAYASTSVSTGSHAWSNTAHESFNYYPVSECLVAAPTACSECTGSTLDKSSNCDPPNCLDSTPTQSTCLAVRTQIGCI